MGRAGGGAAAGAAARKAKEARAGKAGKAGPGAAVSSGAAQQSAEFRDKLAKQIAEEESPQCNRKTFIDFLKDDIGQEESCMTLPCSVGFFVIFMVSIMVHLESELEFNLQNSMRNEVIEGMVWYDGHLNLFDIILQPDWWQWFEEGVAPRLWVRHDYRGQAKSNAAHWDRLLEYNKIVSSVRLIQERSVSVPCDAGDIGSLFYATGCHNDGTQAYEWFGQDGIYFLPKPLKDASVDADEAAEALSSFTQIHGREPIDFEPPPYIDGLIDDKGAKYEIWLDAMWPPEKLNERIAELKQGKFIDQNTRRLIVSLVFYNGELSSGILGEIRLTFEFQLGGFIKAYVAIETTHTEPYFRLEILIVDALFLAFVFHLARGEIGEIREAIKKGKFCEYWQFWNIVDWISILVSSVLVLLWVILVFQVGAVSEQLAEVADLEETELFNGTSIRDWDYGSQFREAQAGSLGVRRDLVAPIQEKYEIIFDDIEAALAMQGNIRLVCAIFCVVLMMRFFKSFSAQPKLAQVTKTMGGAAQDIIHFFLVFIIIFICYAIAGMVIFGSQLYKFNEFHLAFYECFETLMGVFDFDEMYVVDAFGATLWFFSFNILVLLVMLNMLLAIIMDQYTEVKGKATDAQTLWGQTTTLLRRQRQNKLGQRIELSDVLLSVQDAEWEGGEVITTDVLVKHVPKLPPNQAKRLIQRCQAFIKLEMSEGVGLGDSIRQVCHVDRVMHELIDQQIKMMDMTKRAQALAEPGVVVKGASQLDTHRGQKKLGDLLSKLDLGNPDFEEVKRVFTARSSDLGAIHGAA